MSIDECKRALVMMESSKTPGTDGLTSEFYRYFWNAVGKFMVESFKGERKTSSHILLWSLKLWEKLNF